jgi:indole-3-glycerol phosphate synthase
MSILSEIISTKKEEVLLAKALRPLAALEQSIHFAAPTLSFKEYLTRPNSTKIIAEFKRRSPSKGWFNRYANCKEITLSYMQNRASALSILTDSKFFGGTLEDLQVGRRYNLAPILRKDFIIDEYQVFESKASGADGILLIAKVLSKEEIIDLTKVAKSLKVDVILEIHDEDDLQKVPDNDDLIIGVNNRNLETFTVDLEVSKKISKNLIGRFAISESGFKSYGDILELTTYGFKGFLIGEAFMSKISPGEALQEFLE